jgi:hypothetical protein
VIFDRHLQQLPTSVTDWIRGHYQPMDDIEWLWLPRDRDQSP